LCAIDGFHNFRDHHAPNCNRAGLQLKQRHLQLALILVLIGFTASAQTPPADGKFPPFLTWKYFTDDPAAFANFGSVGANLSSRF
jgi:hypothetical protein